MDTSKLIVEIAKPVRCYYSWRWLIVLLIKLFKIGDNSLSRPWSKYSKGSSAFEKLNPKESGNASNKSETMDKEVKKRKFLSLFDEPDTDTSSDSKNTKELDNFLQIMQPRANTKFWDNEDIQSINENGKKKKKQKTSEETPNASKADEKIEKTKEVHSKELKTENKTEGQHNSQIEPSVSSESLEPPVEIGRLFLRNLAYSTTEEDLLKLFKPFGKIREVSRK